MHNLAGIYEAVGQLAKGLHLREEAAKRVEANGFLHDQASIIVENLILTLEKANDLQPADEWRRKWLNFLKSEQGNDSIAYQGGLASFGRSLLVRKDWATAEDILRECLSHRKNTQPDAWSTFNAQSMLGASLLGQSKYTEAEPLLLAGLQGMEDRKATIPPEGLANLAAAVSRLVELYTALEKPEDLAKWKAKFDEIQTGASSDTSQ